MAPAAAPAAAAAGSPALRAYLLFLLAVTALKVLLATAPASQLYRSTDFDVHRNWLATSLHLPPQDWYRDGAPGAPSTAHTLDYPPLFAHFERMLASSRVTRLLLARGWLDGRCLALLDDAEVCPDGGGPSDACVLFQRATVLASDAVLYWGAWFAARAVGGSERGTLAAAALVAGSSGLVLLDHVHFQYNGMLLGILLLSVGCLARGTSWPGPGPDTAPAAACNPWDLAGAFLYAVLLGMKHLYLTLAPLYFVYLLRHTCYVRTSSSPSKGLRFSASNFAAVALVTLFALVPPYLPILFAPGGSPTAAEQLAQVLRRLFPFQRGLCHDYWAANVWSLYLFLGRFAGLVGRALGWDGGNVLPDVPPSVAALFLLMGLLPAVSLAWEIATSLHERRGGSAAGAATEAEAEAGSFLVHAVAFSAFSSFALSYHAHEKAIMTALLPLALLAPRSPRHARLFLRTAALGHFGLLPLLHRPAELALKAALYGAYLAGALCALEWSGGHRGGLLTARDGAGLALLGGVFAFTEVAHPILLSDWEKVAFLPLMMTSITCAIGLIACWGQSFSLMSAAKLEVVASAGGGRREVS